MRAKCWFAISLISTRVAFVHGFLKQAWDTNEGSRSTWSGQAAAGSLASAASALGFVADPQPTTYADIADEEALEKEGMKLARMKDFPVSVMTYEDTDVDMSISANLQRWGRWEQWAVLMLCERWANAGALGTFMDVGANIGAFSMPLASCLRSHKSNRSLVSVEPFPNNTRHLRAGIKFNGFDNVHLYEYAVGSPKIADTVFMKPIKNNQGMPRVTLDPKKIALTDPTVYATTLDSIAKREGIIGKIFAMKMDIEGFEEFALEGAAALMSSPPCVVYAEAPIQRRKRIQKYFEKRGYVYRGDGMSRFFIEGDFQDVETGTGGGSDIWMELPDLAACAKQLK